MSYFDRQRQIARKYNESHDERGRFASGPGGGIGLVSANREEQLRMDQAVQKMKDSPEQRALLAESQKVDEIVGLNSRAQSGIGAWTDGAENTTLQTFTGLPDYEALRTSMAMKGLLWKQKAVIPFMEQEGGPDRLYRFQIKTTDFAQANKELLALGIENHTLIPHSSATEVIVFDKGSTLDSALGRAGEFYDTDIKWWPGRGEFLGDFDSREVGAERYREVIDGWKKSADPTRASGWERLWADRAERTTKAQKAVGRQTLLGAMGFPVRAQKFNETHDEHGRFAAGGGAAQASRLGTDDRLVPGHLRMDSLTAEQQQTIHAHADEGHAQILRVFPDATVPYLMSTRAPLHADVDGMTITGEGGASVVALNPIGEALMQDIRAFETQRWGVRQPSWNVGSEDGRAGNRAAMIQNTFRHEYGHVLDHFARLDHQTSFALDDALTQIVDPQRMASDAAYQKQTTNSIKWKVSEYAATNSREFTAEVFSKMTKPGYVRGTLPAEYEAVVDRMVSGAGDRMRRLTAHMRAQAKKGHGLQIVLEPTLAQRQQMSRMIEEQGAWSVPDSFLIRRA